jgi:hypothetical protein
MQGAQKQRHRIKNHQITEASSANLMLKCEGDAFRFHQMRFLIANRTKAILQTKN